jgi:hypothetical protein
MMLGPASAGDVLVLGEGDPLPPVPADAAAVALAVPPVAEPPPVVVEPPPVVVPSPEVEPPPVVVEPPPVVVPPPEVEPPPVVVEPPPVVVLPPPAVELTDWVADAEVEVLGVGDGLLEPGLARA